MKCALILIAVVAGVGAPTASAARPAIDIDPTDGWVTLDDHPLAIQPVDELPLSRRYFLR